MGRINTLLNKQIKTKRIIVKITLKRTKMGYFEVAPSVIEFSAGGYERNMFDYTDARYAPHIGYVEQILAETVATVRDRIERLLQEREEMALYLIGEGYTQSEIADVEETVKDCKTILTKLQTKNPFVYTPLERKYNCDSNL